MGRVYDRQPIAPQHKLTQAPSVSPLVDKSKIQPKLQPQSARVINQFPQQLSKLHNASIEITAEIRCLALNIYFEARGEADEGQLAVGHVVINRVADSKFPSTLCEVVQQGGEKSRNRCQFSWWCDGRDDTPKNSKAWLSAVVLAKQIYYGLTNDPTDGALWYHATYARPYWRQAFVIGPQIGRHIFYRYA